MDSTQRRVSAAAWSKLEALSKLRKSVQKEMDFINSISPQLSLGKLENTLMEIETFSSKVSEFLSNLQHLNDDAIENYYEELDSNYQVLTDKVSQMLGR
ncbi:MAG: hypothetical protein GC192_10625 [Bacteroidetes bacterium]|nr:hypothetical protein [Bacteroidota bacterium]